MRWLLFYTDQHISHIYIYKHTSTLSLPLCLCMVYGRRFSHLFLWGVSANELPWKVIHVNDSPFIERFRLSENYFAIICFVFVTWYTLYGIYICLNWNNFLFLHNVSFFEFLFIHITIVDFPILTFSQFHSAWLQKNQLFHWYFTHIHMKYYLMFFNPNVIYSLFFTGEKCEWKK